jgi:hypothetical protein
VDCGLILNKYRGFFVKWQEFLGFGIIFKWEKVVDWVHRHGSTVDSIVADGRGSSELSLTAALGHGIMPPSACAAHAAPDLVVGYTPRWTGPCQRYAGRPRAGLPLEISPLAFDLFLYFLNIFKSLQIQKYV